MVGELAAVDLAGKVNRANPVLPLLHLPIRQQGKRRIGIVRRKVQ
jgi:hypothetical protein